MTEQRIAYSPDLLQRLLAYLATRPFQEVYELIHRLQTQGVPTEHPIDAQEAPAHD